MPKKIDVLAIRKNSKNKHCSLLSEHPELAAEWHPIKNGNLTPHDISYGSARKVWWLGKCNHEWEQSINHRSRGQGCPYCAGRKVLIGFNDLASQRPELAKQWHPALNGALKPTDVTCGSDKKVWWRCKQGHEWQTTISNRTMNKGTNCPICHRISEASFPEKTLYFYIKKVFNDAYASHMPQWLKGAEIDIHIPSINYAIEYDGEYWHSNKNHKDKWKTRQCTKHGINLIRIRESGLGLLNDGSTEYLVNANNYGRNDYTELHNIISDILRYLGKDPSNLDFTEYTYAMYLSERDELIASIMDNENNLSLQKLNKQQKKKQVFASHHQPSKRLPSLDQIAPDFIHEWHSIKNGDLKPSDITCGSSKKVWWRCSNGHEWQASVVNRMRNQGCPICSNKKLLTGCNDLKTKFPDIANQWHPVLNGNLLPSDVTYGSSKYAWWKCEHGHEWRAMIAQRTRRNSGCPYCANQRTITGVNDLLTTFPEIAKEWHSTKNVGLINGYKADVSTPDKVHVGSEQVVWWQCECGHEWQKSVRDRIRNPKCPHCGKLNK